MKMIIVNIVLLCLCGCNSNEKKKVLNLGGTNGPPAFGVLHIDTAYTDSSGARQVRLREEHMSCQDLSIYRDGLPRWESDSSVKIYGREQ